MSNLERYAQQVNELSRKAGDAVMKIYKRDFAIYDKPDSSPLTEADLAAHTILIEGLQVLTPNIPVLSEESNADEQTDRFSWDTYWLIDPLDGTKEFIKKNNEFTINVALITSGEPIFGVVYAPAIDTLYWGAKGEGAFKQDTNQTPAAITVSEVPCQNTGWKVVGSRSHQSDEFKQFMKKLPQADIIAMGSSLKLCLVAEGKVDLYPRFGLTSEWDTAAAHAIVLAAGGQVFSMEDMKPLTYNRHPDTLLNPHFIVCPAVSNFWAE